MTPDHSWGRMALAVVVLPAMLSAQAPDSPPNSLSIVQISLHNGTLLITVRNTGDRPITAWAVRGRVDHADGRTARVGMSTDGFLFGFRTDTPPHEPRVFAPGTEMTSRLSSAGRVGTAITAAHSFVPTAVVFDDARAVGDGELIERIFTNREVEWRALETLDRLLNAELSAPSDPRAVVRSLEQQLDEITAEAVRQTLSYKQVTHNLSLTHAVWSSEAAVGERLDGIRAITRRNLHAARAHRQRR